MPDQSWPPINALTLYDALGVPAPPGVAHGETRRSANKETIDNDREDLLAVSLLDSA